MFGIDWSDPQTYWLNVTNIGLGLVTVICFAAVVYAIAREFVLGPDGRDVADEEAVPGETHAFHVRDLGLTMADGGEGVSGKNRGKH